MRYQIYEAKSVKYDAQQRDAVRGGRRGHLPRLPAGRRALTTTYTASQGLLLMIPPMYKIGGEFLRCV